MKIDKIYVILLEHTKEKLESIVRELERLGLERTPYEIIHAHNGHKDPLPPGYVVYNGWKLKDTDNDWWSRDVLPGEIGCAISHHMIWKSMMEEGHQRVLVLEEDFRVINQINRITDRELESVEWDLCYLGRNPITKEKDWEKRGVSENLMTPGPSYNTHAYLLTAEGAKKLALGGLCNNIIPVDEYLIAKYTKHSRHDLDQLFINNLKVLSTKIEMVKQTSTPQTSAVGHGNPIEFEILDDRDWNAWLDKYVDPTIRQGQWDLIVDEHRDTNIYEFPLFTAKFCQEIVALAESKNKWTIDRHANYPTNDVLLEEIGMDKIYNRVIHQIVAPLAIHKWSLEGNDYLQMRSENFMARYTTDRQSFLALHHDFSHITMVVKLNDEFDGGGTWFPKYRILSNPARVGTATLHPGLITHLHGARPITSGKRYICVSFMRKNTPNI
jgi:GR25 family glycosyltransferase involved in LPS biosynthesis